MKPLDVLAAVLILSLPLNAAATAILLYLAARHPTASTLRERATIQLILFCCVGIGAIAGAAELLRITFLPGVGTLMLAAVLVLVTLPGLGWLWVYVRNGF